MVAKRPIICRGLPVWLWKPSVSRPQLSFREIKYAITQLYTTKPEHNIHFFPLKFKTIRSAKLLSGFGRCHPSWILISILLLLCFSPVFTRWEDDTTPTIPGHYVIYCSSAFYHYFFLDAHVHCPVLWPVTCGYIMRWVWWDCAMASLPLFAMQWYGSV